MGLFFSGTYDSLLLLSLFFSFPHHICHSYFPILHYSSSFLLLFKGPLGEAGKLGSWTRGVVIDTVKMVLVDLVLGRVPALEFGLLLYLHMSFLLLLLLLLLRRFHRFPIATR